MGFPHTKHWDDRGEGAHKPKATRYPKTEGKPLSAWDTVSYSQPLGQQRNLLKRRAKEVSVIEQQDCKLLRVAQFPLGVNTQSCPYLTHIPVCAGQSVTLPSF